MTDDEKAQHKSEYQALLALFINFLSNIDVETREEAQYALMELRADLAIDHALKGFNMDEDEALTMLRNIDNNNLTKKDKEKRDRIIAAINNLIEFAVCEEYQVTEQAIELYDDNIELDPEYEIDFNDQEDIDDYYAICALYNDNYAMVENSDIEYAMGVAYKWLQIASEEYLTYMTMNDAKVRPWHMDLQGYTAKRDDFPAWMIPPIEYHCRCYLMSADGFQVMGGLSDIKKVSGKVPTKPSQISDVYSESVAKCGRIFGKSHPYFQVKAADKEFLQSCVESIKAKYYGRT